MSINSKKEYDTSKILNEKQIQLIIGEVELTTKYMEEIFERRKNMKK